MDKKKKLPVRVQMPNRAPILSSTRPWLLLKLPFYLWLKKTACRKSEEKFSMISNMILTLYMKIASRLENAMQGKTS
jgi:hypothetical protein